MRMITQMIPSIPMPAAMGNTFMKKGSATAAAMALPLDYLLSGLGPFSSPSAKDSRMLVSAMMFCMR